MFCGRTWRHADGCKRPRNRGGLVSAVYIALHVVLRCVWRLCLWQLFIHVTEVTCSSTQVIDYSGQEVTRACRWYITSICVWPAHAYSCGERQRSFLSAQPPGSGSFWSTLNDFNRTFLKQRVCLISAVFDYGLGLLLRHVKWYPGIVIKHDLRLKIILQVTKMIMRNLHYIRPLFAEMLPLKFNRPITIENTFYKWKRHICF